MTEALHIRKAAADDAPGILRCLHEAFAPYRDSYTAAAFAATVLTEESLSLRFVEMTVLVAVGETGQIVGTIAYKVDEHGDGRIRGMAVLPQWHGSGAAERLLAHVEADLRGLGCREARLETATVLQRAIRFYERRGYRATGATISFFGMELVSYRNQI